MRKYCMGDFGDSNSEIQTQDDYFGMRVKQMQPAMVEFETEDNVERQLRYELSNLVTEDDFYFEGEESSDIVETPMASIESQSVNMVKPTLEQAAQAVSESQSPKTNKVLVYGGVAALAALMFFGQD